MHQAIASLAAAKIEKAQTASVPPPWKELAGWRTRQYTASTKMLLQKNARRGRGKR
jgi:hypothetical protein